jgi:hypothetical protein
MTTAFFPFTYPHFLEALMYDLEPVLWPMLKHGSSAEHHIKVPFAALLSSSLIRTAELQLVPVNIRE